MSEELRNDVMENVSQVLEDADEFMEVIPRRGVSGKVIGGVALLGAALAGGGVIYHKKKDEFKAKRLEKKVQRNIEDLEDMGFTVTPPETYEDVENCDAQVVESEE